jgi:hypothetical protein
MLTPIEIMTPSDTQKYDSGAGSLALACSRRYPGVSLAARKAMMSKAYAQLLDSREAATVAFLARQQCSAAPSARTRTIFWQRTKSGTAAASLTASNGFRKTRRDSNGLKGTRKRESPYRKGVSGNRRERPGPRYKGSISVGASRNLLILYGFFARLAAASALTLTAI